MLVNPVGLIKGHLNQGCGLSKVKVALPLILFRAEPGVQLHSHPPLGEIGLSDQGAPLWNPKHLARFGCPSGR